MKRLGYGRKVVIAFATLAAIVGGVHRVEAYEVETHAPISEVVVDRSVLSDEEFATSIGLRKSAGDPSQVFPGGDGQSYTIRGLVSLGAVLEDDAPESFFSRETKRPLRHFFDPYRDIPLSLPGWSPDKSPDWALEDGEEIPIQWWSLADARTYFYRAIWSSSETERALWYGALFRSLGHVIHHVQDMAQPQHARDDDHLNERIPLLGDYKYEPSVYEKYTGAITLYDDFRASYLNASYRPVNFRRARDYWNTSAAGTYTGKGMAEFSNRNFVTAGTNFTGSDEEVTPYEGLPRPAPFANFDTTVAEITGNPDSCYQACSSDLCEDLVEVCLPGKMSFYSALASDNLVESPAAREVIIARASTLSIYDQWLRHKRVCLKADSDAPDDGRCINRNRPAGAVLLSA